MERHPLQRLSSPSRTASALIHLLGLASFAASFKYLVDYPNLVNDSYGWHFQYLTIIGLALATATFSVGLLADLTSSTTLFYVKNALSTASAPLEVLISLLYWSLRAIDKRLVIPEWMELNPLADVGFHALPALLLTTDLLVLSPPWTVTPRSAAALSVGLALSYWWWIEFCYARNGWYPYPLFEQVSPPVRGVVFGVSALLMTLSTAGLKYLYERVNGDAAAAIAAAKRTS
ncbi:MAG: hypothetical protein M1832_000412 [Thelocarpon impressellum]|nr:MAG: hypothetical protein M1832_000412 [Thelocarpon impressellum]